MVVEIHATFIKSYNSFATPGKTHRILVTPIKSHDSFATHGKTHNVHTDSRVAKIIKRDILKYILVLFGHRVPTS